jgi:hypothetical protein
VFVEAKEGWSVRLTRARARLSDAPTKSAVRFDSQSVGRNFFRKSPALMDNDGSRLGEELLHLGVAGDEADDVIAWAEHEIVFVGFRG